MVSGVGPGIKLVSSGVKMVETADLAANVVYKANTASDLVKVYRGTSIATEGLIHAETGHILSDAARKTYMQTGSLEKAYKSSQIAHSKWLKIWENENTYAQAHGAFGTELPQAFELNRTFVSVTTDPAVAQRFAGANGRVYEALMSRSQLMQQTLAGTGESEFLIRFGAGGFR